MIHNLLFTINESFYMKKSILNLAVAALIWLPAIAGARQHASSPYRVVWETPGRNVYETVPLGNGEVALNAWIDESGDLKFYIARIDALDENARILKLGSVRFRMGEAGVGRTQTFFRQTLDAERGVLEAEYGTGGDKVSLRLWVDANRPVIVAEISTGKDVAVTAFAECWRNKREPYTSSEFSDLYCNAAHDPATELPQAFVEPDVMLSGINGAIGWYHRNVHSNGYRIAAKMQGLDDFQRDDPLLHRTFGALIRCNHPKRIDDRTLQSAAGRMHRFEIVAHTKHPATEAEWLAEAGRILDDAQSVSIKKRYREHVSWWRDFSARSRIHITPGKLSTPAPAGEDPDDAFVLTRAYTLQRYVSACAGRGSLPIKFNGSLFTVPEKGMPYDADYRRWGTGYWFQNTRLPYLSMPAAGDFDMMQPFFNMYFDMLPLCKHRTKKYFGHDGANYYECMYAWGDVFPEVWGWTPFEKRKEKLQSSGYVKYYWSSGLEIANSMLEYYEYTEDAKFLNDKAIPFAKEILTFFDQHYRLGENGKLHISPAQVLETYWKEVLNPMPEIAGLHAIIERMERLPEAATKDMQPFLSALKRKLPELPTAQSPDGKTMLAPAEQFAPTRSNFENAELYAVYPFRQISYDKNADLGIEALKHRTDSGAFGWRQDDLFMAYLGLAKEARAYLLQRAKNKHSESRFPVFWGPNYDWIPDQDHGGVLCRGVQSLVMQCEGRRIDLFPAWLFDWDCDFKLKAPYQTTVEGKLRDGKLIELKVTPKERKKDVRFLNRPVTGQNESFKDNGLY
jgi:hypothetical protein